jgi:hypothetical protein
LKFDIFTEQELSDLREETDYTKKNKDKNDEDDKKKKKNESPF